MIGLFLFVLIAAYVLLLVRVIAAAANLADYLGRQRQREAAFFVFHAITAARVAR